MNLKDISKATKIPIKVLKRQMRTDGGSVKNQKYIYELLEGCLTMLAQKELRNTKQ